jgi:hypothetical protein
MDWYVVDRRLVPLFDRAPRLVGEGFWVPTKEPIPLGRFLDEGLSEEERDEYGGSFRRLAGARRHRVGAE